MKEFEKPLHIEDQIFNETRTELNSCIQDTIYNMISHGAAAGSVTLKLSLEIEEESAQGREPIRKLHFAHKIGGSIKLESKSSKGEKMNNEDELEFVNDEWILMPITGRAQRTLLDDDEEDA